MKKIEIFKAQGVGGEEIESAEIVLEHPMPSYDATEIAMNTFDLQAERIANLLFDTLPGGTLDRLIGKLLMRKATSFVVPLFGKKS